MTTTIRLLQSQSLEKLEVPSGCPKPERPGGNSLVGPVTPRVASGVYEESGGCPYFAVSIYRVF